MQLPSSRFLVAVNDKVNKSGACDDGPEHQPDGQVRRIEPARTADTKRGNQLVRQRCGPQERICMVLTKGMFIVAREIE
jgi:hypothetical protein